MMKGWTAALFLLVYDGLFGVGFAEQQGSGAGGERRYHALADLIVSALEVDPGYCREITEGVGGDGKQVGVSLRLRYWGKRLAARSASAGDERIAVCRAAAAFAGLPGIVDIAGTEPHALSIELFVQQEYQEFGAGFEPGIHGLELSQGEQKVTMMNTEAIEGNYKQARLLERLCLSADLAASCASDPSVDIAMFTADHTLAAGVGGRRTRLYRGSHPVLNPVPGSLDMGAMRASAEEWFLSSVNASGHFNYKYNPSNGHYSKANNAIRQLMASRLLAEMSAQSPGLLPLHRKNMRFWMRRWIRQVDQHSAVILYRKRAKLGSTAMAIRTLAASPEFGKHRELGKQLVNSVLQAQRADGSWPAFLAGFHQGAADNDYLLYFYSGETILALLEWHEKTADDAVLAAARAAQDHYLRAYGDNIAFYPALVPWHTMSLARLYRATHERRYADAAFAYSDRLLGLQNQSGIPFPDYLGRFFDPLRPEYGTPHSASTAVYTEGLAYALDLARELQDEPRISRYATAIALGLQNLRNLQFDDINSYYLQRPERARGGIRTRVYDNRLRIDNTQHAIDAVRAVQRLGLTEYLDRALAHWSRNRMPNSKSDAGTLLRGRSAGQSPQAGWPAGLTRQRRIAGNFWRAQ